MAIRRLDRRPERKVTRTGAKPPVARLVKRLSEPTVCRRCGAVFARQTWRASRTLTHAALARATWTTCPACRQAGEGIGYGRVIIRGAYAAEHEREIRRRIRNVAERAQFTQPERRVVSVDRREGPAVLEVLTTSQKLAHRIVHELKKAFRGRARYAWSDRDGSLVATWERDR
ncbi:MAG TPA: hypothetical protein VIM86_01950 [Thermodesulfobacteriota bacterium]